jgi:hypothetical protein
MATWRLKTAVRRISLRIVERDRHSICRISLVYGFFSTDVRELHEIRFQPADSSVSQPLSETA